VASLPTPRGPGCIEEGVMRLIFYAC
jgi:hypothetical protein